MRTACSTVDDKDNAVAGIPGMGGLFNGAHHFFDQFVLDHHLQAHLGDELPDNMVTGHPHLTPAKTLDFYDAQARKTAIFRKGARTFEKTKRGIKTSIFLDKPP